jgi:hypothetical protein
VYKKKVTEKNKGIYIMFIILVSFAIIYFSFNIWETWIKYTQSNKRLIQAEDSLNNLNTQLANLEDLKELEVSTTGYEMQVRSIEEIPEEKTHMQRFFGIFKNLFN